MTHQAYFYHFHWLAVSPGRPARPPLGAWDLTLLALDLFLAVFQMGQRPSQPLWCRRANQCDLSGFFRPVYFSQWTRMEELKG